jgi:hypothetical protein
MSASFAPSCRSSACVETLHAVANIGAIGLIDARGLLSDARRLERASRSNRS